MKLKKEVAKVKKLSIIIPHFNSIDLLKKLITSIPVIEDVEIIVVDDNSTEDTLELNRIKTDPKYKHVKYLTNSTSVQSAGACRNIGLEAAIGEWILFADADDYFTENFYEIVKKYFDSTYEVILFTPTSIYIDTKELSDRHIKFENNIKNYNKTQSVKNEVKLRYEYVVPWSKMIKREFLQSNNIKFDEVIAMNDIMFSTKVGHYMNDFLASTEIIYCVTRNKGSLTMLMTKEVHDSRINALLRYYSFIIKHVPKQQRKYLNLSSISALVRTYQSGLGFSEVFRTYKKFRRNNIKTLDRRFLNPIVIFKIAFSKVIFNKKEERYYKT